MELEITEGRSSSTSQGFIVGEDYKWEVKIMDYMKRTIQTEARDKIAQLFILPYFKGKAAPICRIGRFEILGRK